VTTPDPQEPWLLPTAPQQIVSRRRVRPWHVVVGSVLALALLCCGGVTLVKSFTGGGKSNAAAPVFKSPAPAEEPTTSPATTSATPSATPTPRPATTPTTAKPTTKPKPTTAKPTTTKPKPKPTTAKPTTTPPLPVVRAGAFCSPEGAFGVTKNGHLVVCKPSPTDQRNRWRPLVT
jgi:hypothetical protein